MTDPTDTVTCAFDLPHPIDPWALIAITPCPACAGNLRWAEAGQAPGYRVCENCGAAWIGQPAGGDAGRITLTLTRPLA
jgi:hypothetical protein